MEFDPYTEWLGIESMPCGDLELLGLAANDSFDRDAISEAYQARYTHVRQYQVGQLAEVATRILNELSIAYHRLTIGSAERALLKSVGRGSSPALEDKVGSSLEIAPPSDAEHPDEEDEPATETPAAKPSTRFRKGSRKRSRRWYVQTTEGERLGPFTRARVRKHLRRGIVSGDALTWKRGWTVSLPARVVFPEYFTNSETPVVEEAKTGTFDASEALPFEPVLIHDNYPGGPKMAPPQPWTGTAQTNHALSYIWIAIAAISVSVLLAVGSLVMSWRVDSRLRKLDAQANSPTNKRPATNQTNKQVAKPSRLDKTNSAQNTKQSTELREQINEEIEEVYDPSELKALLDYLRRQRVERN